MYGSRLHRPCRLIVVWILLLAVVATAQPLDIDERLTRLRTEPDVTFGTSPSDDLTALPADMLALVSWNIQVGDTSPSASALRPPQVEMALATLFGGTYQLLAAQEISSQAHADKLRDLLPGPASGWTTSFTDTTSTMDNGFWFKSSVTARADTAILHTGATDPVGRYLIDPLRAKHPPRIGHFTIGDFDFTLITLHLTFESGATAESAREFRAVLDYLDAYFNTTGHDPDVIITGDFNMPSQLSGQSGITIDGLLDSDPRFQTGDRRLVVTVHERTSRSSSGQPTNNYDHLILSADCMEEFVQARRVDTNILLERSGEVQPDGARRLTSDHFPIVAFFRTSGTGVARDLP